MPVTISMCQLEGGGVCFLEGKGIKGKEKRALFNTLLVMVLDCFKVNFCISLKKQITGHNLFNITKIYHSVVLNLS